MKYSIIFILFSFILAGCGSNNSNEQNDPFGINGFWVSSCFEVENSAFYIQTYNFSGSSWSSSVALYLDPNCTQLSNSASYSGEFSVGDSVLTESGVTVNEINFIISSTNEINYQPEDSVERLDLIKIDTNVLYFGEPSSFSVRPRNLNFDAIYQRN